MSSDETPPDCLKVLISKNIHPSILLSMVQSLGKGRTAAQTRDARFLLEQNTKTGKKSTKLQQSIPNVHKI
jgi:hypothetical protein